MMAKVFDRYWRGLLVVATIVAICIWIKYYADVLTKQGIEVLPEVTAIPIKEEKVSVEKTYVGYVIPVNEVDVYSYISGFIGEILINGGQNVKAGDELIKIKPEEYEAIFGEAKAAETKAEADFNYAQNYYERMKKAGIKAVSQTELDNARAKFLATKGALEQAKASVEKAKVNLGYTVITATIDGVIGTVRLSVGDYVSPQKSLFSIVQTDPMRVVFSISDKDYLRENNRGKMFDEKRIGLILADGTSYEYEGKFQYVDNAMDKATDTIAVYADFVNPDKKLVDNSYVTVVIEQQYKGILVPKDLVKLLPGGAEVNIAEGDIVKPHMTSILDEYGDKYILQNNFEKGMLLIVDEVEIKANGQKMKVIEAEM